jgi:hypothetical protein
MNTSTSRALLATLCIAAAQLQNLVGPVALYPDDLLALVLPAK